MVVQTQVAAAERACLLVHVCAIGSPCCRQNIPKRGPESHLANSTAHMHARDTSMCGFRSSLEAPPALRSRMASPLALMEAPISAPSADTSTEGAAEEEHIIILGPLVLRCCTQLETLGLLLLDSARRAEVVAAAPLVMSGREHRMDAVETGTRAAALPVNANAMLAAKVLRPALCIPRPMGVCAPSSWQDRRDPQRPLSTQRRPGQGGSQTILEMDDVPVFVSKSMQSAVPLWVRFHSGANRKLEAGGEGDKAVKEPTIPACFLGVTKARVLEVRQEKAVYL